MGREGEIPYNGRISLNPGSGIKRLMTKQTNHDQMMQSPTRVPINAHRNYTLQPQVNENIGSNKSYNVGSSIHLPPHMNVIQLQNFKMNPNYFKNRTSLSSRE